MRDLNLTDAQRAQLESIREAQRAQLLAVRNDTSLTADQRQEKIRSIMDSARQQTMSVLTPQQQETLQNNRHGRGWPRGRGERHMFGGADLGLSDQQKSQLMAIHQNTRQEALAIRSDSTLSPDQKSAKLKSLHQSTRQQLDAILTPEQRMTVKEERRRRNGRRRPRGEFLPPASTPRAKPAE